MQPHTYHKISLDKTEIWYQKLGHLNYKSLTKIVNVGVVRGILKLGMKKDRLCKPCQLGK